MTHTFRNLIAGEWVDGATPKPNRNPSDISDVIGCEGRALPTRKAHVVSREAP